MGTIAGKAALPISFLYPPSIRGALCFSPVYLSICLPVCLSVCPSVMPLKMKSLSNQLLPDFSSYQFETLQINYKHIADGHVFFCRQKINF